MVQLELDKARTLKFDLAAISALESSMNGMPLADVIGQWSRVGVTAICAGLWAGLKHDDQALTPSLTRKILQKYIDDGKSLTHVARALNQAIEESGLFGKEEQEGNAQTAAAQ